MQAKFAYKALVASGKKRIARSIYLSVCELVIGLSALAGILNISY